jgi:hypothetical protein
MEKLTKEYLVAAGVPEVDAVKVLSADLSDRQVGHLLIRAEVADYPVLAYDADVALVIDGGRVVALDGTHRVVNSTAVAFLQVLGRYQQYVQEVVGITNDEEGEQVAIRAADEMRLLDPSAFEDESQYWPIVCAQMIEGNL